MSEPILEPIRVRYAVWPGERHLAFEALMEDDRGRLVPLLWTLDQEEGRMVEWWPYKLGMLRRR